MKIQNGDVAIWDISEFGYCVTIFMEVTDERMVCHLHDSFKSGSEIEIYHRVHQPEGSIDYYWNSKEQWAEGGWRFL